MQQKEAAKSSSSQGCLFLSRKILILNPSFQSKVICEVTTSLPLLNIPHYCAGPSVCQGAVDVHPDTDMHLLALDYDNEIAVCLTVSKKI